MEVKYNLEEAISILQKRYPTYNWEWYPDGNPDAPERVYKWPGKEEEPILVNVYQSEGKREVFHRHDYFAFQYTLRGEYQSISFRNNSIVTIKENEIYACQPYSGHALLVPDCKNNIIVSVIIQKTTFYKYFLPLLSSDFRLLEFFLKPLREKTAEEFLHFKIKDKRRIHKLIELLVIESAENRLYRYEAIKSLSLAYLIELTRQYVQVNPNKKENLLSHEIVQYIGEHYSDVTLQEMAEHFSYNQNYLSSFIKNNLGKTFSQVVLEQRMLRAVIFLEETNLSISEIADVLGYSNTSSFYKSFRKYYHTTPKEFIESIK